MHLAVVMLDMYVATSPCPPSESLHISDHSNNRYDAIQHNRPNEVLFHWKCLLETCIAGYEANYVREAVNVLDALTSNCVLPPHIKYLAKHYRNVIISDGPSAPCRPADHVLEEQNMVVKDLIRRSDGKWSIRFLDDMALAAISSRRTLNNVTRFWHPKRHVSSRHTDGDLTTELKNAQQAMVSEFGRADVVFSSEGIDIIEDRYRDPDYIARRIQNHWFHLRVERGQVMADAVTSLDDCTCERMCFVSIKIIANVTETLKPMMNKGEDRNSYM